MEKLANRYGGQLLLIIASLTVLTSASSNVRRADEDGARLAPAAALQSKVCWYWRLPHPLDPKEYLQCDPLTGEETVKQCHKGTQFNHVLQSCEDPPTGQENSCRFDHLVQSPGDCSSFLQCSNGVLYELQCPEGLMFNMQMQYCDYEENVVCSSPLDSSTTSGTQSPSSTGSSSITTQGGDPTTAGYSSTTPEGVTPVTCCPTEHGGTTTTPREVTPSSATITSTTFSPSSTLSSICNTPGNRPNPDNLTSYYECVPDDSCQLHPVPMKCPENQVFDPIANECWYPCEPIYPDEAAKLCGIMDCPTPLMCHGDRKWKVEGKNLCWFFHQCILRKDFDPIRYVKPSMTIGGDSASLNSGLWEVCIFKCGKNSSGKQLQFHKSGQCVLPAIDRVCDREDFATASKSIYNYLIA